MFRNRKKSSRHKAAIRDNELTALLREWQGIEPSSDFESSVWRRIRAATETESSSWSIGDGLYESINLKLVRNTLAAAAVGILLGISTAFFLSVSAVEADSVDHLLQPRTLAGSYAEMIAGEL